MRDQETPRGDIVCPYGFGRRVGGTLQDAVEKVTGALKNEGFGVLTEINVKDTLKNKLDVDFRGYVWRQVHNVRPAPPQSGQRPTSSSA